MIIWKFLSCSTRHGKVLSPSVGELSLALQGQDRPTSLYLPCCTVEDPIAIGKMQVSEGPLGPFCHGLQEINPQVYVLCAILPISSIFKGHFS